MKDSINFVYKLILTSLLLIVILFLYGNNVQAQSCNYLGSTSSCACGSSCTFDCNTTCTSYSHDYKPSYVCSSGLTSCTQGINCSLEYCAGGSFANCNCGETSGYPICNSSVCNNCTCFPLVQATNTPTPQATNTPIPGATNTPIPQATNTPVPPGVTNTPIPIFLNPKPGLTFVIYNDLDGDGNWDFGAGGEKRLSVSTDTCSTGYTESITPDFSLTVPNQIGPNAAGWICGNGSPSGDGGACGTGANKDWCDDSLSCNGWGNNTVEYTSTGQKKCGNGCSFHWQSNSYSCAGDTTHYGALCNSNLDYCGVGTNVDKGNLRLGPRYQAGHLNGWETVTFFIPSGWLLTNSTSAKIGSQTNFTCVNVSGGQNCSGSVEFADAGTADGGFAIMGNLIKFGVAQVPTPTLYPPITVLGNNAAGTLGEYNGNSCTMRIDDSLVPTIRLQAPNMNGIISNCEATPGVGGYASYGCTVSYNNQTSTPAPLPTQSFTLTINNTIYTTNPYFVMGGVCSAGPGVGNSVGLDPRVATTVYRDILYDVSAPSTGPWTKLKNTSYLSYTGNLTNFIPNTITAYDSDDDGTKKFVLDQAGVVGVSGSTMNFGAGSASTHNWRQISDSSVTSITPSRFLEYVKSRKASVAFSEDDGNFSPNAITIITVPNIEGGQNIGNINIDTSDSSVVIAVKSDGSLGNLTIYNEDSEPIFNASKKSLAFIANKITFSDLITEANGIFIANEIDTGSPTDQGLKVTGNLIAQTGFTNVRAWTDNRKPSLFVVGSPKMYIDLLPWLSTATYDWQLLQ